jgi:hypothetical protein
MTTFEHLGWFEEYYIRQPDGSYKWKGKIACGDPAPRKVGTDGMEDCVLTEPVALTTSLKTVVVKASAKKPVEARTIVYPLCGRVIPSRQPMTSSSQ